MDIDEIRRMNLRELEKIHGPDLAKKAGMSPTQFYNLRDGAKDSKTGKPRGMRKETAWKLEDAAGKPRGYLDKMHGENSSENPLTNLNLSAEDIDLLKAFKKIESASDRRQVIGYTQGIADRQKNMQNLQIAGKAKKTALSR